MSVTLPASVSESAFSRAIDGFSAALGTDKVLTSDAARADFRDPFQHPASDDYMASAIVMPTTVEEVQEVVRVANEHRVPLWAHARGMNNGYGGPAPRVNGSVIVSLRNMNKVLEVNEESAYAVVEPGASWFDLYNAIQAGGHDLWLSCADIGWGSVVGNSLDNGCTYLPYGADFQAPCGMELVLASGEVLRTGMGALPNSRALAPLPPRPRADAGAALHPVQLRHRDQDGRLADCPSPRPTCRSGSGAGRTTTSVRSPTSCASCCSIARSRAFRRSSTRC